MSLLENKRIINVYNKKGKKSIRLAERIDLFLIIALAVVILTPIIIHLVIKLNTELKKKNLFLSSYCVELFGAEKTETLLENFSAAYPDIRIQIISFPDEKNRSPDIFIFDEDEYRTLLSAGELAKLNPYIYKETDGDMYAVPLVSFMDLLFYNIDLLSSVGFDRPPKTREEFFSYARTIAGGSNARRAYVSGSALSLSADDKQSLSRDVFSWIWAAGGDFWAEENLPALNARTAVTDFSFIRNLYNEGALAPGIFESTGAQRLEEFSRGRISMIISSIRAIPFLRDRMGDSAFGITTIPVSNSAGNYNISLSGIYAGVNANSEYPEEALCFIEFLAEQHRLFNETFGPVFGVASYLIPDDKINYDPFYSKARDIFESSEIVRGFSGNPNAQEYEDAFMEEFQSFLNGSQTAQQAVNAIQQKWEEISGNKR